MPLYEYQCSQCGKRVEKRQKFADAPLTECPFCGGPLKKLISAPAVQFKGGGWYADGYGSSKSSSSASAEGSGSGTDAKADSGSSSTSSGTSQRQAVHQIPQAAVLRQAAPLPLLLRLQARPRPANSTGQAPAFAYLLSLPAASSGAGGTFFPARRASDKPIAIACLGFVTFFLLRPMVSLPSCISCNSRPTCSEAAGEYLRPLLFLAAALVAVFAGVFAAAPARLPGAFFALFFAVAMNPLT